MGPRRRTQGALARLLDALRRLLHPGVPAPAPVPARSARRGRVVAVLRDGAAGAR